ncbi:MAG: ABC transporter permease, partial [Terriglobales bacterium]
LVWNDGTPTEISGARISAGFFTAMLQVAPRRGRAFTSADFQSGRRVAVVSYGFWKAHLGGSPGALGRVLHLNGQPYAVVGILGREFDVPAGTDIFLPLHYTPLEWSTTWRQVENGPSSAWGSSSGAAELVVWARLRSPVSWQRANAELAALSHGLPEGGAPAPRLSAQPVNNWVNGNITPIFADTLLGAMAFLLLLACANVANMNLARASARRHELALRAALGASGWRLMQMTLIESLVLALLGGVLGIAMARPMLRLLGTAAPKGFSANVTGYSRIGLNYHGMLLALVICAGAGILSGLAPAWRVLRDREGLKPVHAAPGRNGSEGGRARQLLVGAQAALALVLLTCTALMMTSFSHFASGARRFRPGGVLTFAVNLPATRYATAAQRVEFYRNLLQRLHAIPGVQSAVALTTTPFSNDGTNWITYAEASAPTSAHSAVEQDVSPGYFAALHIDLLGRRFRVDDTASAPGIVIVSATVARLRWPGQSAIGKHLRLGKHSPWLTVVGVAADAEYSWENQGATAAIYRPLQQAAPASSILAVRSQTPPASLAAAVRSQAAQLDPRLPLLNLRSLQADIAFGLAPIYLVGYMMSALGVIALILALAGLYGVAAYSAQRRLREMGVRAVCGARPSQLIGLMVSRGMRAVLTGLALGVIGAVLFERVSAGFFFGVQPGDPWPLLGAAALLVITALAASYLPARRAAASDPMRVLREE